MNVFDLFARLSLDTSEYERNLNEAQRQSSVFGDVLKANLAADVIKKGFDVASDAISTFTKGAVATGQQFDASMSQVAATMGVTVDEIQHLRDFAQEMGATTAFSASQAADALNYMALAGYDAKTSMSMLPNVLNLAASGGIDLAYASDMVTDASSALGLSLDQTSELVDKMAKASSKSNTSVAQLGEAILTVGGTAKNLAGGTTELSTALGILADNGTKGAEGGTALRNILLSLGAPGDKAAATLEALGVSAYDADGNMRPLQDTFSDLNAVMANMTTADKTDIINTIFNKTDLKNVNALLATSSDRWEELSAAIDDAAGAAQAMADTQLDNLQGDLTIMQSALEGAQIVLSDKLTPAIRNFVQAGTAGLSALTEMLKSGEIEKALHPIANVFSSSWGAAEQAAENVLPVVEEAFSHLREELEPLIERFSSYSESGQLLNDMTTIIAATVTIFANALALTVELLADVVDGIDTLVYWLNSGDEAAENLKTIVVALTAAFVGYKAALAIGTAITAVINSVKALTSAEVLAEIAQKALNLAMELNPIGLVVAAITGLIAAFGYLWNTNETFRNFWILVWNDIKENFELVADGLIWFFGTAIPEAIEVLKNKSIEIGEKILETGDVLEQFFSDTIPAAMEQTKQDIEDTSSVVKQFFTDTIPAAIENAIHFFKNFVGQAKTWGSDLIDNFITGIKQKWEDLKQSVTDTADIVKQFLGFSEPEKGPLSNFSTYAPDMMRLFAKGIEDNTHLLTDQISKSFDFGGLIGGMNEEAQTSAALSKVPLLTPTAGQNGGQVVNKFYIDGREFAKIITPYLNAENQRVGMSVAKGALT